MVISGNCGKKPPLLRNPPPLFVEPRFLDLVDFGFGPDLGAGLPRVLGGGATVAPHRGGFWAKMDHFECISALYGMRNLKIFRLRRQKGIFRYKIAPQARKN